MKNNVVLILQSISIIFLGMIVALIFKCFIGEWAFIPLAIAYWGSIALITKFNWRNVLDLFSERPGNKIMKACTYIPCLFCVVAFIWGLSVIDVRPHLIVLTIIFTIVNPIMEEIMWRKYLIDNLLLSKIGKIFLTTVLFSLSHPLMWGVFSVTIRSKVMIIPLIIMGIIWGISYMKLCSLKHCIIAHGIVDLLNLSIWVFLNEYIPPVV